MTLKTLGKYEIIEKLGEGATAEVYRARDTVLGREVALKVLKPALVADPSAFERFVKEAQAAAGLFHDHIATVLDMGEADGRYFIAMRYIPGQSLDKVLAEKGPLTWEETLRMAKQIGAALDFAHEQGFLHRDVKPSNIIHTPKGDFVLTDFGLQRAMMSTGLTSHTGVVLGTPPYIAPEIWDGKPAVAATDQYALACVVDEAITGKVLFAGDTPPAVMKKHLDGWAVPSTWPKSVPAGVGTVLGKALTKYPKDRYQSMVEFTRAMERLAHGIQPALEPQPREEKTMPLARRCFPWKPLGIGLLIIFVLVCVIWGVSLLIRKVPVVVLPTETPIPSSALPYPQVIIATVPYATLPTNTHYPTYTPYPTYTFQPTSIATITSEQIFEEYGFTFELIECRGGEDVTCTLKITNTENQDREISIDDARSIDNLGNENNENVGVNYDLGSSWGSDWVKNILISNAPTNAAITFRNISQDAISLTVLKFRCDFVADNKYFTNLYVYFRNITIKR